ncbi:hypothetical protein DRP77_05710 [Candidatus Poribacteria bacterium]|nr:MAG: hypothetical protein DRP77_05710 [Candidatus Poribacteria bacterium]
MDLEKRLEGIKSMAGADPEYAERFAHEVRFARRMIDAKPDKKGEWEPLLERAIRHVEDKLKEDPSKVREAVEEAEKILEPLGKAAKEYTIYCVGHAHIDMNWMWNWPETVAVINDTFSTVDRLMDEFPEFKFSQSQASVYLAMKEYLPELFERVKKRVKEGRWEITASTWVEGDENLSAGETLCRHLLYTKRFISKLFDVPIDHVKIDWQPDLFGHPHTIPTILARAGVKRYYFCRGGKGHRLFWWKGPDGSKVLAFDDAVLWYLGPMKPEDVTRLIFDFEKATGLKEYLFVYGVGDHGGGPTRRDLRMAYEMNSWPIFPRIVLSTTDEFFSAIEPKLPDDLPVVDDELNFVFRGCYTSQSNIKRANRYSENRLFEAETVAVIASRLLGMPYPAGELEEAWRRTMFNQFHDILPGSGVRATYEYAQGLFQEVMARTGTIKTRGLRALAAKVDTTGMDGLPKGEKPGDKVGEGIGAGVGNESAFGRVSAASGGAVSLEPFLIYNPLPWSRSDVVLVKVWDKEMPDGHVKVVTPSGEAMAGQIIERGGYWGHNFTTIAFPVSDLPPMGYRIYGVDRSDEPIEAEPRAKAEGNVLENELLRVEVDPESGAIRSLIDKRTGCELVPKGRKLGMLQWLLEEPHGMTAWEIGKIVEQIDIDSGAEVEVVRRGPYLATIRSKNRFKSSTFEMDISLKAGLPMVEFTLRIFWLERGSPDYGVPMLKVVFPVAIRNGRALFEIPFGYIERPTNGEEVPALRWVDLTGEAIDGGGKAGVTLVNECKYGHNVSEGEIKLTLLRSSYDPDPLPELGHHEIRFALIPHGGDWAVSDAVRLGREFNHPFEVVSTDVHPGDLPKEKGFLSVKPSNVILAAVKKAEDDDGLIIRLYEVEGKSVEAEVWIDPSIVRPNSPAVEVDLLERPLEANTARMEGEVLKVRVPARGIATVKIG